LIGHAEFWREVGINGRTPTRWVATCSSLGHRHNDAVDGSRELTSRRAVMDGDDRLPAELGWYPREPPGPDYGVDLFVEAADGGVPNGRLLAVQVKGGTSFFAERSGDNVVFRFNQRHLAYWTGYSLPVIVALHDPESGRVLWQVIDERTAVSTGEHARVLVPEAQLLDASSARAFTELVAATPSASARLDLLRADLGWMQLLADGGPVLLEAEEGMNKTSGRGTVALIGAPRSGGEELRRKRIFFFGLQPYAQALPALVPWADIAVDEATYDEAEEDPWTQEEGFYDEEQGRTIIVGHNVSSWREARGFVGLRPYEVAADEVARWRLELTLNDLGRGRLAIDRYLTG
jgi:hypothetical protein